MCRLLYVRSEGPFRIESHLRPFSRLSKASKEYQGDGWGCAYSVSGKWHFHHDVRPIWEDDLHQFGETTLLLAHARSAFEGSEIQVENNMPFHDDRYVFVFNGELRGVRIREEGRIGAEKLFNFIKRFDRGDMFQALERGVRAIKNLTQYVRAMNIVIADQRRAFLSSSFCEDPEYFTMWKKQQEGVIQVCSEPYAGEVNWSRIPGNTTLVL